MTSFFIGLMLGIFIGCWIVYFAHDWIWRS